MSTGFQVAREAARRTNPKRLKHEHFCAFCYGKSRQNRGRAYSTNGWWKCGQHPCTKGVRCLCNVHEEEAK